MQGISFGGVATQIQRLARRYWYSNQPVPGPMPCPLVPPKFVCKLDIF